MGRPGQLRPTPRGRAASSTPKSSATGRSTSGSCPSTPQRPSAPWRSSARSTATRFVSSPSATASSRASSAAAATSIGPATSVCAPSPASGAWPRGCGASKPSPVAVRWSWSRSGPGWPTILRLGTRPPSNSFPDLLDKRERQLAELEKEVKTLKHKLASGDAGVEEIREEVEGVTVLARTGPRDEPRRAPQSRRHHASEARFGSCRARDGVRRQGDPARRCHRRPHRSSQGR